MESSQEELLKRITSFLERYKILYLITGAWSVIFWGRPRASHDIDFVVELNKSDVKGVKNAFKSLPEEFLVSLDDIEEAIVKKDMFNVLHLPTMLKIDFWLLQEEAFDKSCFGRRKKEKILGQEMYIAGAEDTIIQKLRWYKEAKVEKHLVDAAFVFKIQKDNLDNKYLEEWIKKLGLMSLFEEMKKIKIEDYI